MAERTTRSSDWSYAEFVLANAEVAEKGHMACIDTASGEVKPGQESTTLVPVGYFEENLVGDGSKKVRVRLFKEKRLHWWENDTNPDDVVAADIMKVCYIKDSKTVSASDAAGTRSVAGIVWGVHSTHGVLVEMEEPWS